MPVTYSKAIKTHCCRRSLRCSDSTEGEQDPEEQNACLRVHTGEGECSSRDAHDSPATRNFRPERSEGMSCGRIRHERRTGVGATAVATSRMDAPVCPNTNASFRRRYSSVITMKGHIVQCTSAPSRKQGCKSQARTGLPQRHYAFEPIRNEKFTQKRNNRGRRLKWSMILRQASRA